MSNSRRGNKTIQPINSIDIKHTEMLDRFEKIENVIIPNLKKEKEELKEKVSILKEHELDEFMKIKDRVNEIK